ncbi:hypothetical protein LV83_02987 [Algoriphagus yeomjeoni]|uniref:Uncharacterized protein n=1 Tax=Algoriphagus yeomjeoni TaxID=291403 RepID=A0A327P729_9BACT|nr:hypothetical protein LV83_02987 [Algoriphagus yeomjeoni]
MRFERKAGNIQETPYLVVDITKGFCLKIHLSYGFVTFLWTRLSTLQVYTGLSVNSLRRPSGFAIMSRQTKTR